MDWRLLTLITILTWGGYSVLLKWAGGKIAWQASMFLFVLSYAVTVGLYCLLQKSFTASDLLCGKAGAPLLAGVLCALGAITFFKALPSAPGSLFIPLVSLYTVVAAATCLFLFKEPVTPRLIIGMLCAAAAGILLGITE